MLCVEVFDCSLLLLAARISRTRAVVESIMIGDSFTIPLTIDPIQGRLS